MGEVDPARGGVGLAPFALFLDRESSADSEGVAAPNPQFVATQMPHPGNLGQRMLIVPHSWQLPASIRSRLGKTTYGKQRAIIEDHNVLLVLHKPPGPDDSEREGVLFWREPDGDWKASTSGPGGIALRKHVQSYVDLESTLTDRYEQACDATTLFEILEAATPLARAARNMHAALQAARDVIDNDPLLIEARDLASDAERNLELLVEDVRHAIQFRTAKEAEEQARLSREALHASHRLNILAALFLPLTAVTSILGMNVKSGLDERSPSLFWIVLGCGVGLGLVLMAWVLARPPKGK